MLGGFERGRYVETLPALDQRAQIAPARVDLTVIRGYTYLRLNRLVDARRVFEAAAGTGSRDAIRASGDLRDITSGNKFAFRRGSAEQPSARRFMKR